MNSPLISKGHADLLQHSQKTHEKPPPREMIKYKTNQGFTLIEVLIAVVIVSILAAIAYPSFTIYVTKSRMKAGQAFLQEISVSQQRYYDVHRSYAADLVTLGIEQVDSNLQRDFEQVRIVVSTPAPGGVPDPTLVRVKPSFVAVLQPRTVGRLAGQYAMGINAEGNKWMESDNNCNIPAALGSAQEAAWPTHCCGTTNGGCPSSGATPSSAPNLYSLNTFRNTSTCRDRRWEDWNILPEANRQTGGCP